MPKYEVKNVKSFMGREGHGFECTLYKDGVRLGTVLDSAYGGPIDFFIDKKEKDLLDAYCKTLPPVDSGLDCGDEDPTIEVDADIFISRLIDEFDKNKQIKKWCKKKTVFQLSGDKEGVYRTMNVVYSPMIKSLMEKKYEGKGLVIMNETIK